MKDLPLVSLGRGCMVSRFMAGSNPMSGFSHQSPERDREMLDYYTAENILGLFKRCRELGIRSIQLRGDRLMRRMIRDFRLSGGDLTWVAQTATEFEDQDVHVRQLAADGAAAIYLHGTWVDNRFHDGRAERVHDLLKTVRDLGVATGLGTHRPEVLEYAEEKGWDLDFYMTSFYNLAKQHKNVAAVEGLTPSKEEYLREDRERMTAAIRSTPKPCMAFKVFAGGRNTRTPEGTRQALEYAYSHIKPSDAVIAGVFQGDRDELAEDVVIVRSILRV